MLTRNDDGTMTIEHEGESYEVSEITARILCQWIEDDIERGMSEVRAVELATRYIIGRIRYENNALIERV